tara:strand:+ start:976 stop:2076 length:1101 start_codon:yes stop_codon:yes gene_type:complete
MSKQTYNETEATNAKSQYTENDVCDFMIQELADTDLVANSVVLSFDLQVQEPSGTRAVDKQIFFNNNAGAHCFIDSINVSTNLGQLEHISEYSRMVAMFEVASKADNDTFNTSDACEMISTNQKQSTGYCEGNVTDGTGSAVAIAEDCDVALKPRCVLNKMSGNLPFSKVGYVKLSVTFAKVLDALFTNESAPTMKYIISNLKCRYKTAPTQNQKVMMRSVVCLKSSINSSNANISAKVPAVCNAVSCILLKQGDESSATKDGQTLAKVALDSVNFLFSDNLNKHVTYDLTDRGAILQNFVESIGNTGHNRIHANRWKGDFFGIGLNWKQFIDLSQQKFNIQLKTADVSNTNPYLINMYFHSVTSI